MEDVTKRFYVFCKDSKNTKEASVAQSIYNRIKTDHKIYSMITRYDHEFIKKIALEFNTKIIFLVGDFNVDELAFIRQNRKDIFLVGCSVSNDESLEQRYVKALDLCKKSSCNLVLSVNDSFTANMIITPEESYYHNSSDIEETLEGLVEMARLRSHLTFTRSTVVSGEPIAWDSEEVPEALRAVVDHCIKQGAYKVFNGSTVGHFACKKNETTFLTSMRRTNFNDLYKNGLVKVVTDGPDTVIAYGAKPSVGGQSQRIIFKDHEGYDCVVHFHCNKREGSDIPVVSQREVECGSHECGANTSSGLKQYGNLKAVHLDNHGPNIIFHHSINPQEVIDFIEANFDLSSKTGVNFSKMSR